MSAELPPEEDGWPVLGNAVPLVKRPIQFRKEVIDRHGGIARTQAGPIEMFFVSRPEYIEEVLVTKDESFQKPSIMRDNLGEAFGEGLLLSGGKLWDDQRELIQESFYPERLAEYVDQMVETTEEVLGEWEDGTYDVKAQMEAITVPVLVETLFGTDDVAYLERIEEGAEAITMKWKPSELSFYLPNWVPTPINRRYKDGIELLDGVADDIIQERREGFEREDLLSVLLSAADDEDSYVTEQLVRDEMLTMMTGGSGPPAYALATTLFLLARNSEIQQRVREEVQTELGEDDPTMADLSELEYMEQVYNEALRLHPPVWMLGREPIEDVTIGGYRIPEGSPVNVTPWHTHRNEEYFPDPESFRPERWAGEPDHPPYAYLPFGAGPRVCIGNKFAIAEAKIVLSAILRQFDLSPAHDDDLEFLISTHMSPVNANVEVRRR